MSHEARIKHCEESIDFWSRQLCDCGDPFASARLREALQMRSLVSAYKPLLEDKIAFNAKLLANLNCDPSDTAP